MNIWLSSLRIRAHLSWRTGKHLHVLHVLWTYPTCSYPGYQDTTTYAALYAGWKTPVLEKWWNRNVHIVILANFVFKRCVDILHLLLEETVASRSKRPASSIRVFGFAGELSSSVPSKAQIKAATIFGLLIHENRALITLFKFSTRPWGHNCPNQTTCFVHLDLCICQLCFIRNRKWEIGNKQSRAI